MYLTINGLTYFNMEKVFQKVQPIVKYINFVTGKMRTQF